MVVGGRGWCLGFLRMFNFLVAFSLRVVLFFSILVVVLVSSSSWVDLDVGDWVVMASSISSSTYRTTVTNP